MLLRVLSCRIRLLWLVYLLNFCVQPLLDELISFAELTLQNEVSFLPFWLRQL